MQSEHHRREGEIVRQYKQEDRPDLLRLMDELQAHVAALDPLRRVKASEDFDAGAYVDHLLGRVEQHDGVIVVAESGGALLGFIAGGMTEETEEDLLDHYPTKEGMIYELVVSQEARGRNVGRRLLEALERHLKEKGCAAIRVGCFVPNAGAHAFYEKCGYADRYVEMLKQL